MQASTLFTKELELLEGCPELSQSTCDALTKLFSAAWQVNFYDLTDPKHVHFEEPDVEADADPDNLPRHNDVTLEFFIDPAKLASGMDPSSVVKPYAEVVKAVAELNKIIDERNTKYKSWDEIYGTTGGFMAEARKFVTGVDEPIRTWLLKQSHLYSVAIDEPIGADGLLVSVTVHAIIEDK